MSGKRATRLGSIRERILVIGRTPLATAIVREIDAGAASRWSLVGIVDDPPAASQEPVHRPLLGPMTDLARIVDETRPDRVVVALGERRRRTPVRALVESCLARGIIVEDAAEFYERITGQLAIDCLTPTSLIYARRFGPTRNAQAFSRALSLLVAGAGLILCLPLAVAIALAIKIDSAGPVLFVQRRIGRHGRPFPLLKFRTMHEASGRHSEWERDNRDRVTRVGRILRAFRLDELPQFVNILRGEMNLVGPRPHPASNYELFTLVARNLNQVTGGAIGYYTLRSMVRPGMTGWAQVRYRYANDLDEEIEKLRYDLYYVKYASPRLDLRILAETIAVVLKGHPVAGGSRAAAPEAAAAPVPLAATVNTTQAA
jgi:exopolysaccharide biosynthesis polyprenyl glycosylphosphotransferase